MSGTEDNNQRPTGFASGQTKLSLRSVHKSFGQTKVLNGIDLEVDEHEVVCLIGPSGCGKSTLLRCIDLLDPIDAGSIWLDGEEITAPGADADTLRRRMAIVFQSFNLFPHLSLLNNVTLAPRRVHKMSQSDAEEKAHVLLRRFGLSDIANSYPNKMSGGQNQRAAIVRALMLEPEVLLLDEVTSALDPELVGEVLSVIRELSDQGLTMLLATHEMGFARDAATTVAFLHNGRVLESGPPSAIFDDAKEERTRQFLRRVSEAGRI